MFVLVFIFFTINQGGAKMEILADVLEKNLKVVFCGTAVGDESKRKEAYYAGQGNQFYVIIHKIGLTPRKLRPEEFKALPQYGIGLTDLVKGKHGTDNKLKHSDFNIEELREKIIKFEPKVLAFNGKKASEVYFGKKVDYGMQKEKIGNTIIFVLPSTSGSARGFWNEKYWRELAEFLKKKG